MAKRPRSAMIDWPLLGDRIRERESDALVSIIRSGTGATRPDGVEHELVIPLEGSGSYLIRARSTELQVGSDAKASAIARLDTHVVTQLGRGFTTVIRASHPTGPEASAGLTQSLADRLCEEAEALREVFGLEMRQGPGPDWPLDL